jgi:hypothetical protein
MPSRNCPGFIPASIDTVESEGLADEAVMNKVMKKINNMFYMGMFVRVNQKIKFLNCSF